MVDVRRALVIVPLLVVLLLLPLVVSLVGAWANGWTIADVTTGSMRPNTPPGSMVVLVPISPADVEVGDVIGYRDDVRGVVTHRVVAVLDQPGGRYFTTQGDANARPDARPVPGRAIVGEVRWRVAGLGGVVRGVGERRTQLALIVAPAALLAASELAGWRGRRQSRLVAALRAEIAALRNRPEPEPVVVHVPVAAAPATAVVRVAAPAPPPRPLGHHDGTACVAGL